MTEEVHRNEKCKKKLIRNVSYCDSILQINYTNPYYLCLHFKT